MGNEWRRYHASMVEQISTPCLQLQQLLFGNDDHEGIDGSMHGASGLEGSNRT